MHCTVGQTLLHTLDLLATTALASGEPLTASAPDSHLKAAACQHRDSEALASLPDGQEGFSALAVCSRSSVWLRKLGWRAHLEPHDLLDLAELQRLEDHELVDAIHELRPEMRLHL